MAGTERGMSEADRTRWRSGAAPVGVGVGAALLAAVGYWNPSLWTDEAATISSATRPLPALWALVHHVDAVHGVYYLGMHGWIALFGSSAASIRLPSVLAVGAGAAGMVVLGRMLGSARLGVLAGVAYAILPRVTWAGTEARSYALTAAVAVWLTVVLLRAVGRGGRWWIGYAALAAFGVLLYLYLLLVVLAHGAALAWWARGRWRRLLPWLAASAAPLAALVPFLLLTVAQSGQITHARPTPTHAATQVLVDQWFLGAFPNRHAVLALAQPYNWGIAAVTVAVACWLLIAWGVARYRPADPAPGPGAVTLAVPMLVLPTAAVLGYSLVGHPIYAPRYLVVSLPAVALLVAAGLASLPGRWAPALALVVVAALTVPVYVAQRRTTGKVDSDWKLVAELMQARARPGDTVVYGLLAFKASQTTRKIAVGYGGVFDELRDVTYGRSEVAREALWASSRPLAAVIHDVPPAPRVWLITDTARGPTWQARVARYRAQLESVGYRAVHVWRWTVTQVTEYVPG